MDLVEIVQLLASAVTIVTVLFLFHQSKMQTISTKSQVYQNFVSNSLEIDHVLIQHPNLRKYVYGRAEIKEDEVDVDLLMCVVELMIDVVENIHVFEDNLPVDRRDGWLAFADDVTSSSAYEYYMKRHGEWYQVKG